MCDDKRLFLDMIKSGMDDVLSDSVEILLGDYGTMINLIRKLPGNFIGIRDKLYWLKFRAFLQGTFRYNAESLRKFSEKLANENAGVDCIRIISTIDQIRQIDSIKYISNLTRAFINDYIDKEMYFRLCDVILKLLPGDIEYIISNINKRDLEYNYNAVALESNQLMYKSIMGKDARCCFLPLARKLYEFALTYDD